MSLGLRQFFEAFVVDASDESLAARLQLCIAQLEGHLLRVAAAIERIVNAVDIKILRVEDRVAEELVPLHQLELGDKGPAKLPNFVVEFMPLLV